MVLQKRTDCELRIRIDSRVPLCQRGTRYRFSVQSKRSRKEIEQDEKNESVAVNVVSKKATLNRTHKKRPKTRILCPFSASFCGVRRFRSDLAKSRSFNK